jgi:adenylate cyclase
MKAKLQISSTVGSESFEYEIVKPETKIGRSPQNNDVVLIDVQISREHSIIRRDGDTFFLVDLQSANGCFVNGDKVSGEHSFTEKDTLQIGKYLLKLHCEREKVVLPPKPVQSATSHTVLLRAPVNASMLIPKMDSGKIINDSDTDLLKKELEELRKKSEVLTYIYELGNMFNSVFALEDIFEKMSEMLFRVTPAERCVVQLKDDETGELVVKAVKFRSQKDNQGGHITPPRAIVQQVMQEQAALLLLDAQDANKGGATAIIQGVQSVICAPLIVGGQPIGVLYVDNRKSTTGFEIPKVFGSEDLDLLSAIASQTSMALDNSKAHNRLMKEALAREAYGRFLPDNIVSKILESPESLKLGGTNIEATILFADVRGFTPLSEKLQPQEIVELLNEYFTNMTDIIFSHQGMLDKYMGDGLMALFGVGYDDKEVNENAAVNAARAAMDMQRKMVDLRKKFFEQFGHEINIGIGINTGVITVGFIGSNRRMEYTGIGDPVNLAARLEANSKNSTTQVLISAATYEKIKDKIPTRRLAPIEVKGKSEPQEVYEVVW